MENTATSPALAKGPWTAAKHEGEGNYWYVQYEQDGKFYIIADVLTEKDAKLMAAAPKMLETLKGLRDYMGHSDENGNLYPMDSEQVKHCRKNAIAAIDAVESKTPPSRS